MKLFKKINYQEKAFIYYYYFLISWRLITLQYYSGFCHTLTWISLGYTCIPHPDPPSHLPLHPIPLGQGEGGMFQENSIQEKAFKLKDSIKIWSTQSNIIQHFNTLFLLHALNTFSYWETRIITIISFPLQLRNIYLRANCTILPLWFHKNEKQARLIRILKRG